MESYLARGACAAARLLHVWHGNAADLEPAPNARVLCCVLLALRLPLVRYHAVLHVWAALGLFYPCFVHEANLLMIVRATRKRAKHFPPVTKVTLQSLVSPLQVLAFRVPKAKHCIIDAYIGARQRRK